MKRIVNLAKSYEHLTERERALIVRALNRTDRQMKLSPGLLPLASKNDVLAVIDDELEGKNDNIKDQDGYVLKIKTSPWAPQSKIDLLEKPSAEELKVLKAKVSGDGKISLKNKIKLKLGL
jgi:hypothetical protein